MYVNEIACHFCRSNFIDIKIDDIFLHFFSFMFLQKMFCSIVVCLNQRNKTKNVCCREWARFNIRLQLCKIVDYVMRRIYLNNKKNVKIVFFVWQLYEGETGSAIIPMCLYLFNTSLHQPICITCIWIEMETQKNERKKKQNKQVRERERETFLNEMYPSS